MKTFSLVIDENGVQATEPEACILCDKFKDCGGKKGLLDGGCLIPCG